MKKIQAKNNGSLNSDRLYRYMRLLYLVFPIRDALRHGMNWAH